MIKHLILIVLLGLLLYVPHLSNSFVWDDEEQILANESVHSLSHLPQLLSGSTFNSGGGENLGGLYYKPLMSVSFALLYTLFGPTPWAFHGFQLLLHVGSTVLLYLLFRSLLARPGLSLFLSLVFLLHPLNVETVAYSSALQDTLYFFFGILGLTWLVLSHGRPLWHDQLFLALLLFLSILGKETGALFFLLLPLYQLLYYSFTHSLRLLPSLLLPAAIYSYLRFGLAQVMLGTNLFTPITHLSLGERLLQIPSLVAHYLSLFVYPAQLAISQHWVAPLNLTGFWLPLLLCSVLLAVLAFSTSRLQHHPLYRSFLFFTLWFTLALGFHLQLFPLDMTVADRWFYLPMAGLLGMLGVYLSTLTPLSLLRLTYFFPVLLVALFARSYARLTNWATGLSLYQHDIILMPNSFDLNNNLGVELYRQGELARAKQYFTRSTELAPSWWTNWNNLGVIVEGEGDLDLALSYYKKAINNGQYYLAYPNYAQVLLKQGKVAEARAFLADTLRYFPHNSRLVELYRYTLYTLNQ